jgi:hypothetical protein
MNAKQFMHLAYSHLRQKHGGASAPCERPAKCRCGMCEPVAMTADLCVTAVPSILESVRRVASRTTHNQVAQFARIAHPPAHLIFNVPVGHWVVINVPSVAGLPG